MTQRPRHDVVGWFIALLVGVVLAIWLLGLVCAQVEQTFLDRTPMDMDRGGPLNLGLVTWFPGLRHLSGGPRWYNWTAVAGGVLTNGPQWGPPSCPGAEVEMRFDGINDYIEVGTPVIVTDLPRKTVVLRLSLAAFNAAGPARLVEKRDPNTGWTFAANNTNIPSGLSFTQDFSTTSGQWGLSNAITTNTCYTLGFTYDNTSTSNQPTFFIDGVAFAPTDVITGPPAGTASSDATSSLKLGDQGDGTRAFSGVMLDVRIYNRILDAREMRDLHLAYTERDGYARLFLAPLESLSYVQPAGAGPVLRRRAPHTYQ